MSLTKISRQVVEEDVLYVHPDHTGDVTSTADGATVLVANAVTLDKLATLATDSFLGRDTAGEGNAEVISAASARTILNVENGATADQTGAEIKTAYEGEANTNAYTDAEKTKLTGIETAATADQTGAEIKTAYEGEADTNAYTDAEKTKLAGVATSANNYTHPANHPPSIITQDSTNRFVTDADKTNWNGKIDSADEGVADGIATLDGDGKVPTSQLPASIVGAVSYVGTWNATTNTPSLTDGSGAQGVYYKVSVAGTTALDGESDWEIGDWVISNGTAWEKVDNSELLTSVAGRTGDVTLAQADIAGLTTASSPTFTGATLSADLVTTSTVDGRDVSVDGTKLDGIETAATADQTGAEIKTLYEGEADTNAYTNAYKTKLDGIETAATADQTGAEIKTAYEGEADTNAYSDAEKAKLAGVATSANLYVHPDHTGDVTSTADGATVITANSVTLAKMATMATDSFLGRDTAGVGNVEVMSAGAVRTILNVEDGATADQTGAEIKTAYESEADTNAFSDAYKTKVDGVADGANLYVHPNHSGDVTSTADGATVITNNSVTLAKMATMATDSFLGRDTDAAGNVEVLSPASARGILNVEDGSTADQTGAEIKTAYEGEADTNAYTDAEKSKLAGVATSANLYVHPNHTGDVTSTGDGATVITNNSVTLAKMAQMATASFLGRDTAGSGNVEVMSAVSVRAILNVEDGSNNYTHPANHSPSTITQDTTNRFVTDAEKATWNGKQDNLGYTPSDSADEGVASGIATLDGDGKVPTSQLPASIVGAVSYVGTWNAATNTPSLTDGSGAQGAYYKVSVAGTTALDGISSWDIGDWVISNGTAWEKVDNSELLTSVAGRTGDVTLVQADIAGLTTASSPTFTGATLSADLVTTSTVDGRDVSVDGTKLDGIEDGATADQTGAEIKTAYEAEADTNAFSDAEKAKLAAVAANANLYVHPNHTGEVTSTADGATVIAANVVTLAKMATMATDSFLGRDTAGVGNVEVLAPSAVRTILNVEDGSTGDQTGAEIKTAYEGEADTNAYTDAEKTKLAAVAANANLYVHPNHTGDVTSTADGATVITANSVTLAKMATMATDSFLGRDTAGTGNVEVMSAGAVRTILNVEDGSTGDQTGAEIKTAYEGEADTNAFSDAYKTKLDGVATSANLYVHPNHTGDVTSTADGATVITNNSVTLAKMATMATASFLGRDTAGSGNVEVVSAADARTILNVENGATADQTGAEIKTAYEGEANTNAFTDAEQTKLAGIETAATADQTGAEIKTAYEGEANTNAFTDAEQTKLAGVAESANNYTHPANHSPSIITQDATNRFVTDADKTNWNGKIDSADEGVADGIATLDGDGKVPASQLPASIVGAVSYAGAWNATTNTPTLTDGSGAQGVYYKVSVAGTTALDGESDWEIGDWAISNGTAWEKVDNSELLTSVAGRTGDVTLAQADIAGLTTASSPTFTGATLSADLVTTSTIDGRDVSVDGTKLDGIEDGATADQTGAEIKTAYEAEADTNAFSDAYKTKVDGIETAATADQTGAEIKTAYEAEANTNAYTDAEKTKLTGVATNANLYVHPNHSGEVTSTADGATVITNNAVTLAKMDTMATDSFLGRDTAGVGNVEVMSASTARTILNVEDGSTADQTGAEIKTAYEAEANTNAYTDAEKTKLTGIETSATADQTGAEIKTAYEAELDTNAYTDAEKTKLTGIETAATADQTGAEIKTAYEGEADTNAYTDAEKSKLAGVATSANLYVHPNHTGDVTSTGDGATVIVNNAVTLAKMATMATDSFLGRDTVGDGNVEVVNASDARVILNVEDGATADQTGAEIKTAYEGEADTNAYTDAEKTKLAGVATSANLYVHPNHTGDVTSTADGATVIAANVVTLAKMATMATDSFLGRDTAGVGNVEVMTASAARTILNVEDGSTADQTGAEIKTAYEGEADTNAYTDAEKTKLAGVATSANLYVHPDHTGDVTSTADGATVITNNSVTLAKMATVATDSFLGRDTAGTGNVEVMDVTTVRSVLDIEAGANNYTHPANHSPSIITQDTTNRFVTDAEKSTWNGKQDNLGYTPSDSADEGVADGIATLDGDGKVPTSQLPASIVGAVSYVGTWNATTNTPSLTDGSGAQGVYYKVSVAGTTALDGESDWEISDWVISNGTAWEKVDNSELLTSVAGRTGDVTLAQADIAGLTTASSPTFTGATLSADLVTTSTVDGRDVSVDGTKLDGIETAATADQTGAEIKTLYEGEADTNAFSDAYKTKLDGVDTNANLYVHPNHTGEVTSTADGATVIAANVVTLAKMATMATDSFLGRDTAGVGNVEVLAPSAVRTILNVEDGSTGDQTGAEIKTAYEGEADTNAYTDVEKSKLAGVATSANLYVHPDHTGDVTSTADGATVITNNSVTLAKMATMATDSFLGRDTAGVGNVEVMTASAARTILNVEDGATADQTGAEIKTAYEGESNTNAFTDAYKTKLDGVATSANLYVHPNHTGEVTSTADGDTVIAANVVTLAKMAQMATASFLGRDTAGSGNVEVVSAADARGILNVENGSTADQTGAEIKTAYEGEANTNAYTDAEKTKLAGVEASANNYTHPDTNGTRHVPAGGTTGQILENSTFGTAVWVDTNKPITVDTFVGTGSQTDFTMGETPVSKQAIMVTTDGVKQHVSAYSFSGTTLTLTSAPDAGVAIEVVHLQANNGTAPSAAQSPVAIDNFTGTGSQTDFTMSEIPESEQAMMISLNGIRQHTNAYSFSGLVLTFSSAPANTVDIEVVHLRSGSNPSDQVLNTTSSPTFVDIEVGSISSLLDKIAALEARLDALEA